MTELPASDRIARHISKGRHKGNIADGLTGVVDSSAFMPRPDYPPGTGLEEYLSVNWVECFAGELERKLSLVTKEMQGRLKGFDNQRSRIGILKVQTVHEAAALKPKRINVRIVDPGNDVSHAGVYGMDLQDEIIAQELARRVLLYRPRLVARAPAKTEAEDARHRERSPPVGEGSGGSMRRRRAPRARQR